MNISDLSGTVTLANGVKMPYFGLGVYLASDGKEVGAAIQHAFDAGYRHIDTAALYDNEKGVGQAIRESNINRNEIFLTSKVWNSDQGYDSTLRAFEASLTRLGLDYLDLYLIHWPVKGKYTETWRALEKIYKEGRVKAIGVSNFLQHHVEDILQMAEVVPMVNQMEFHPFLVQQSLIDFCKQNNIQYESWSPLMHGAIFTVPLLNEIARKYNKNVAQLVLRWNLQKGVVVIPKSVHQHRIVSNADIFDFEISDEDMQKIDSLDCGKRTGADPDNFNF
jgi:diketogulonate reductase-like aldo/keto reductase